MKHSKLAILGLVVVGSALAAPVAFAQQPTTGTQGAAATSQDPTATQSGTVTDSAATTQGATTSQGTTTTQGQDAWSQGTGSNATTQGNAGHDGSTHSGSTHSGSAGAATGAAPASTARQVTWTDLDADKDGTLSKTEVTPLPSLSQVFDQADADADSKLTADEYKAYVAKSGNTGSGSGN